MKATNPSGPAFSLTSLGRFFLRFPIAYFLLFIPRVAGSKRTIQLFASDFNPSSPAWKPHFVRGSDSGFLYTTSPGIFLGLSVPRGASFVKFYGHKRADASLYGVCLDCHGVPEPVDGHNASILTGYELVPSCLFSLSINGSDVPLLELYNLYDQRFDMFGEITFSHVEYSIEDQADGSTSSDPMYPCVSHFDWTRSHSDQTRLRRTLLPRAGPTSTGSPSHDDGDGLSGKMDLLIGLVAALVTIVVVIFIIAILYMLYLRRRERMLWLDTHSVSGKPGQNGMQAPANKSTTLLSATETIGPDLPPKDLETARYKDRYIVSEQKISMISNPTSSFSTHANETKYRRDPGRIPIQSPQADAIIIASSVSRPKSRAGPPATAPPGRPLPVPEVPRVPESVWSPRDTGTGNTRAEVFTLLSSSNRSQIDSKAQRPHLGTTQPGDPQVGDSRERKDEITLQRPIPSHMRNHQGSDGSISSSEGHPKLNQRPPYSHPPKLLPEPSLLLKPTSPSSTNAGRRRGQETTADGGSAQRPGPSNVHRQWDSSLADTQLRMRLIRESLASPHLDNITSLRAPSLHERARSSDDIRQRTEHDVHIQTRALRESKSSPELESSGTKLSALRPQIPIPENRNGFPESLRREPRARESLHPQKSSYLSRRLTIKLPDDPPDWLSPIPHILSLPKETEVKAQRLPATFPASLAKTVYSSKEIEQPAQAKGAVVINSNRRIERKTPQPPELVLTPTRTNAAQSPIPQPPSYDRAAASTQILSVEPPTIPPLSPRKRALPKIPGT